MAQGRPDSPQGPRRTSAIGEKPQHREDQTRPKDLAEPQLGEEPRHREDQTWPKDLAQLGEEPWHREAEPLRGKTYPQDGVWPHPLYC